MSTPSAPLKRSRVPSTSKRELAVALACGLALLVAIGFGIWTLGFHKFEPPTNLLSGQIVEKKASGLKETEINVGSKGLRESVADSGYSFMIRVAAENRVYEVPVSKSIYQSKRVGDIQSFIRPPSEQH